MDTFMMICYVMASFLKPGTDEVFVVPREKIGTFIKTPAWVKDTLEFKLLMRDKSIRVAADTLKERAKQENDPMDGIGADGKAEEISRAAEADIEKQSDNGDSETGSEEPEQKNTEPVQVKNNTRSTKTTRKSKKDDAE